MAKLIAENLNNDLSSLSNYETLFREGDSGELRVYLENPLSEDDIYRLENELCNQGVLLTAPITQDARILVIKFRKAIAPLLVIGGVIAAIVAGVIGWQLFKSAMLSIPVWAWILGGVVIGYAGLRRKKWAGKR